MNAPVGLGGLAVPVAPVGSAAPDDAAVPAGAVLLSAGLTMMEDADGTTTGVT